LAVPGFSSWYNGGGHVEVMDITVYQATKGWLFLFATKKKTRQLTKGGA